MGEADLVEGPVDRPLRDRVKASAADRRMMDPAVHLRAGGEVSVHRLSR